MQSSDIDTNVSFISSMRIMSRPNGPYCPSPLVCTGGPKAGYALMQSQLTIFLRIDVSDVVTSIYLKRLCQLLSL